MNIAVLASGYGSNLQAIIDAIKENRIQACLRVVFSDKKTAFALKRAQDAHVCVVESFSPKEFSSREVFDLKVVELLKREHIDVVILAGYMRILTPVFVKAFENRILNIHPSLLPNFKGAHAIKDAFNAGVKETGVSVHVVDEELDHGFVLAQEVVDIKQEDTLETLEARIHQVEHQLYPKVIDAFLRGQFNQMKK